MGSFERARTEEVPAWIDDEVGQASQAVPGAMQDAELRLLKDGVLSRMAHRAPEDALDHIGSTMWLGRFHKETAERYRERLEATWDAHERGGLPSGVTGILADMLIADVLLKEDHDWDAAPGDWHSRFWPIIGPDFGPTLQTLPLTTPFVTGEATETTTGGATTMGSSAVRAEILQFKREVLKYKHPGSYPAHLIMTWDGVPIQGIVATPFMTGDVPAYVPIGKLQGLTVNTAPFTPGGFIE